MRDLIEKYVAIRDEFPNKAGKLRQVMETQRRLLTDVMKQQHTPESQALVVNCAEAYVVSIDLLEYMHKLTIGVAEDALALADGAEIRNINRMQGEEIQRLWAKLDELGLR